MIPPQGHADCAAALEQVLDVSRRPSEAAWPGVCRDEAPRPLLRETRAPVPAVPGRPARADSADRRCGSCSVCLATEPWAGRRRTQVTTRRTPTDGARFLRETAERHPEAEKIMLVRDNLNTHRPGALDEALAPAALERRAGPAAGGAADAQSGHRGATLRRTAHPDHVETYRPPHCDRCGAPLAGLPRRTAERWRACVAQVHARVATAAGVQHWDETGFRVGGKTQWLHGLSTPALTSSRSSARRGSLLQGLGWWGAASKRQCSRTAQESRCLTPPRSWGAMSALP